MKLAALSVLLAACGQQADLVVSFDGLVCSLQTDATGNDDIVSIGMHNNSYQPVWFGIGGIPPGMTLDQMVESANSADGIRTEAVMGLFDPTVAEIGEQVPAGGLQLV